MNDRPIEAAQLAQAIREDGCCHHWKEVVKFLDHLASAPIEAAQTSADDEGEFLSALDSRGIACDPILALEIRELVLASAPPAAATEPMDLADMNEMDAKHPGWDAPAAATVPAFPFKGPDGLDLSQRGAATVEVPDERKAFETRFATASAQRQGIELGWRGIAFAAWQARAALSTPTEGGELPAPNKSRVDRLIDAIEGECDGLAVDNETAARILEYVDTGRLWTAEDDEIAEPVAYAVFADNGNIRIWSTSPDLRKDLGTVVPLYARPTPAAAAGVPPGYVLVPREQLEHWKQWAASTSISEAMTAMLAASGAPAGVSDSTIEKIESLIRAASSGDMHVSNAVAGARALLGSVHQAPPRNDQDCREGSDSSNAAPGAGGSAR